MGIPQLILLIMTAANLLIVSKKHGQTAPNYNIWKTIIGTAISYTILISGGFFD